ncbi:MAG TPA: P-type conjugative transfer protein TrbG [Asticcacaulis sp.]|nr:P-type conjugative transfer protein TrbG [Asticcacaulis sp.]
MTHAYHLASAIFGVSFVVSGAQARATPPVQITPPELKPVVAATKASTLGPDAGAFIKAMAVYPFHDGDIYRLFTAPNRVSDIVLQPGETLISIGAGDTVSWTIGDTHSGEGGGRQVHILVRPQRAGLTTNLVITTSLRTYRIELSSVAHTAMAAISWRYADRELMAIKETNPSLISDRVAPSPKVSTQPKAPTIEALARLNFNYSLSGDHPAWRPLHVFDNGEKVFIQFPDSSVSADIPPLFEIGDDGKPQLVNYRVVGSTYVVDHLIRAAELRLGGKHMQIVRITKQAKAVGGRS